MFRCIEDGLRGRFASAPRNGLDAPAAPTSLLDLFDPRSCTLLGGGAVARPARELQPPFTEREDALRLVLRPGAEGPTRVRFDLAGRFRELSAVAKPGLHDGPDSVPDAVELVVRVDGRESARLRLAPGAPGQRIDADLTGARTLELVVALADGQRADLSNWIYLASPTLR